MDNETKYYIRKAKQFIKENRTLVACACTYIVAAKITHDSVLKTATKNIGPVIDELMRENEVVLLQNTVMLDFINRKELGGELTSHILSMRG
jgi:hypothetical protein